MYTHTHKMFFCFQAAKKKALLFQFLQNVKIVKKIGFTVKVNHNVKEPSDCSYRICYKNLTFVYTIYTRWFITPNGCLASEEKHNASGSNFKLLVLLFDFRPLLIEFHVPTSLIKTCKLHAFSDILIK